MTRPSDREFRSALTGGPPRVSEAAARRIFDHPDEVAAELREALRDLRLRLAEIGARDP